MSPKQEGKKFNLFDKVEVTARGFPGAVVEFSQGERTLRRVTDAHGHFFFESLDPGHWTLTLLDSALPDRHRIQYEEQHFELKPGQELMTNIQLIPEKRRLHLLDLNSPLSVVVPKLE